ncbi:hypothetical protein WQ57_12295 [Mesobacillus campisalis]|uniref:Uncharacterized protein n=1 Tax=Mesobacillus campisalis TaxID=1408103 RepID=A0A0M2SUB1_9BACI|nr:hypothetical protein [Mesobacillus campisalis]KKK37733.1 hypothetical protein WQ57_12295 [Mesobacillus campisalis]
MDIASQMAAELKQMIQAGEIQEDITDELQAIIQGLESGKRQMNDYYGASTSGKVLQVLDEVNQRIKK